MTMQHQGVIYLHRIHRCNCGTIGQALTAQNHTYIHKYTVSLSQWIIVTSINRCNLKSTHNKLT